MGRLIDHHVEGSPPLGRLRPAPELQVLGGEGQGRECGGQLRATPACVGEQIGLGRPRWA